MVTHQDELWLAVLPSLRPGVWTSLQEIYDAVREVIDFDEDDLKPEVKGKQQRAWQRNVRNTLRQKLKERQVLWKPGALYSLPESGSSTSANWSAEECRATVADYFDMLLRELDSTSYNKSAHRRRLLGKLQGRSEGAIERKHQNISAILLELSLPFIEGYKPLGNYQELLEQVVIEYLDTSSLIRDKLEQSAGNTPASVLSPTKVESVFTDPPKRGSMLEFRASQGPNRIVQVVDYQKHEAQNRELGKRGEEYVVELEKRRLSELGHEDLANRVEWISRTQGDGLGYDIRSFEPPGTEIFIEVKTTCRGKLHPFPVTRNEVRISEVLGSAFRLYRVFNFAGEPSVFVLQGSLKESCRLIPLTYEARL